LNNACPSCGAVYSVQPQHVGRRLSCKKCGTALVVGEGGIRLANSEPAPEAGLAEAPSTPSLAVDDRELSPARLSGSRPTSSEPVWPRIADSIRRVMVALDLPTWIFGLGLLLVLPCFFLPLVDQARLAGHRAALRVHEDRGVQQEREWKDQKETDDAQRQRARDSWTKEKTRLEEQVKEATVGAARGLPAYYYGILIGCILLGLASLAYLRPTQSGIRRVVGAIVLLAQVLLVLLASFLQALVLRP
jgi:hypothetical protein